MIKTHLRTSPPDVLNSTDARAHHSFQGEAIKEVVQRLVFEKKRNERVAQRLLDGNRAQVRHLRGGRGRDRAGMCMCVCVCVCVCVCWFGLLATFAVLILIEILGMACLAFQLPFPLLSPPMDLIGFSQRVPFLVPTKKIGI